MIIGKFCSIACGAKFLFNSANHNMSSLSTYPFPLFFEEWNLKKENVTESWNNKGDIVVGNDAWISDEVISKLLEIKWWDWEKNRIQNNIEKIKSGDIENLR